MIIISLVGFLVFSPCEALERGPWYTADKIAQFEDRRFIYSDPTRSLFLDIKGKRVTVASGGDGSRELNLVQGIFTAGNQLVVVSSHRLQWFSLDGAFVAEQRLPEKISWGESNAPGIRETLSRLIGLDKPKPATFWQVKKVVEGFVVTKMANDEDVEVLWLSEDGRRLEPLFANENPHTQQASAEKAFKPFPVVSFVDVSLDRKWATTFLPKTSRVYVFDMVNRKLHAEHVLDVERVPVDKSLFAREIRKEKELVAKHGPDAGGSTFREKNLPKYLPPICNVRFGLEGELLVRTGHPKQAITTLAMSRDGEVIGPMQLDHKVLNYVIAEKDGNFLVVRFLEDGPCLAWMSLAETKRLLSAKP